MHSLLDFAMLDKEGNRASKDVSLYLGPLRPALCVYIGCSLLRVSCAWEDNVCPQSACISMVPLHTLPQSQIAVCEAVMACIAVLAS